MIRQPSKARVLLFFLLLCSISMCFYWSHIQRNWGGAANPQGPAPRTDLFAQWYGARELLLHHRDPYSDDVTREIQIAYYGQQLDPSQTADVSHQQRFAYPLYVVFFLAPTVHLEFRTVEIISGLILFTITALSFPLWARTIGLSLSAPGWAILLAISFTSIPILHALDHLQLTLLVAAFLAAAAALAACGHLFLAGFLLALATLKPQLCLLPGAWFALWVASDWRQRRSLLWGFFLTLGALILASERLMPTWLARFPSVLLSYERHTHAPFLLGVLLPSPLQWLTAIVVIFVAAQFCWRARHQRAGSPSFALAIAFSLTLSILVIPAVSQPFNDLVLLPVLLLVVRYRRELRAGSFLSCSAFYACCALGLLSWPLAFAVVAARLLPGFAWLQRAWFAPLNASLALPFAAFGFLLLLRSHVGNSASTAVTAKVATPIPCGLASG